jgi:hypothetical protein
VTVKKFGENVPIIKIFDLVAAGRSRRARTDTTAEIIEGKRPRFSA